MTTLDQRMMLLDIDGILTRCEATPTDALCHPSDYSDYSDYSEVKPQKKIPPMDYTTGGIPLITTVSTTVYFHLFNFSRSSLC